MVYLAAAAAAPCLYAGIASAGPFFMGSDISLLPFMQQQGVTFKDNGVAQQADQILYDNGDNLFRLRLFINPQTTYTNSNVGAIQNTAYDIALAQQIKANDPSAKIELDLHYSDTWADPGHQTTPTEWSADNSLTLLQNQVYNYTLGTLNSFSAAGVMPDIVQLGNETNSGMLWPQGEITFSGTTAVQQASWAAYGSLVNSGIAAVRAAQGAGPKTQISLVIGNGNSSGEPAYFYTTLTNPSWGNVPSSSFDIMGVDYYPSTHDISTLSSNLTTLANDFGTKKIMVMETDAPWTTDSGLAHDPNYAETPAGQAAYFSEVASTVQNLPNGDGMGLLYWYPEAVQVKGYNIYNGGDTALFDASGNALQTIIGTATAGQSGNGDFSITQHQWNISGSGTWETSGNWTNSSPTGSDVEADFLNQISGNQTVSTSTAITLGTMRFQSPSTYTIAGSGSLTLQATVGWGYIVVQQGAQLINIPTTIASSTTFSVAAGTSLTFGSSVTVNSGQVLNPSGTGTINYESSINVGPAASMTIANSTHSPALTIGTGGNVAISGAGTAFEVDSISNSGTITINSSSSSPTLVVNGAITGAGNIVNNGGLNFTTAASPSVSSAISGSGFVTQNGSGVVALTASNTYTGPTTINTGTLQVGNANALGFGGAVVGVNAPVAVATVNSAGTLDLNGQTLNKPIVLNGGALTNSSASPAGLSSGVAGYVLNSVGSGVTSNATTVSGGAGSGATALLLLGLTAADVSVTSGGSYFAVPTVTITGGGGTGATATAILSGGTSGSLTGFKITNPGFGYTSTPTVSLATNYATTPAIITTNANNFIAVGAEALSAGTGYSSAPSVTASGPDTAAPTLTAVLNTVSVQASSTINGVGSIALNNVSGAASSGTVTLDLDGSSSASAINGSIIDGASGGNLALLKTNTSTWTLNGANAYTGGTTVNNGALVINGAGALPANQPVTVNGGLLEFTAALAGSSVSLSPLSITGGVAQFADNVTAGNAPGVSNVNITSLSITGTGTLDIGNNHLIIEYGAVDPIASIASLIASGAYGSGTTVSWTGTGITSADAALNSASYGIGYADAADAGNPAGLSAGQIEVMYTLLGDANLDGKVNGTDFNLMATNFNQAVTDGWDEGDFNYDNKVNGNDFVLLADNFNQFSSQSAVSTADLNALDSFAAANGISLANVPEPASAAILVIAGSLILRRRRNT